MLAMKVGITVSWVYFNNELLSCLGAVACCFEGLASTEESWNQCCSGQDSLALYTRTMDGQESDDASRLAISSTSGARRLI